MYGQALKPLDRSWIFNDATVKESTVKPLCQQVEQKFQLPARRLCRYFAGSDDPYLLMRFGQNFRGFYLPFPESARAEWPPHLLHCFFRPFDETPGDAVIAFDSLIYIRHSTCADMTGLVETYAHELQHFVQHVNAPRLVEVNNVLYESLKGLDQTAITSNIPSERDANVVSKGVAEEVCGAEAVKAFAEQQIRLMEEARDDNERRRWIFFRDWPSSMRYEPLEDTVRLVEKYKTRLSFPKYVSEPKWWMRSEDPCECEAGAAQP